MTKLHEPVNDEELERRLRITFRTVMPMLDHRHLAARTGARSASADDLNPDLDVDVGSAQSASRRGRLTMVGSALLASAAVVTLLMIVGQRNDDSPAPPPAPAQANQPSVLPSADPAPGASSTVPPPGCANRNTDMPVLIGQTVEAANLVLAPFCIRPWITYIEPGNTGTAAPTFPSGTISSQEPPAGTKIPFGALVTLTAQSTPLPGMSLPPATAKPASGN